MDYWHSLHFEPTARCLELCVEATWHNLPQEQECSRKYETTLVVFQCSKNIYLLNSKVLLKALFRALKICYRRWTSLLSTNWVSSALPIFEMLLTSHDCTAAPIKRLQQSVLLTFIKYWNPCAVSTKNIRIKMSFLLGPREFWRHLYHSTYHPANPIWNCFNCLIR